MHRSRNFVILLITLATISTGCSHTQLRYNHVNQAKSLTSIYEKQVLDNLAMFADNKEALPFFAVPSGGSATVNDAGALSASPLNGPVHTALSLSSLSRNSGGQWTFLPVTDPDKLRRMRCAYRRAVGMSNPNDVCTNCCTLEQAFKGKRPSDVTVCCDCCAARPLKIEIVGKRLAHRPCEKVGSYCGTHIRVCPESYDDFTLLVFKIMEYATKDAKGHPKDAEAEIVHFHYDAMGRVDYIDRFKAKAHPFATNEAKEDGSMKQVVPLEGTKPDTQSSFDAQKSEVFREQLNQQYRSLFQGTN